jgi:TnpA family transposase
VKSLKKIEQKSNWFDVLEGQSIRLQFRVSSLLRLLEFNPLCSSFVLLKTIDYFKSVKGDVTPKAPTGFLNDKERKALTKGDVKGESFRVSLYKIFLFIHVAEGIKSGKLNLIHSYRYKSLEEYLIDAVTWETQKESLIKQAGIEEFMDFNKTIEKLKGTLEKTYDKANASLKDNLFVSFDPKGKIKVATPKVDNDEMEYISSLLKEPSQTSIYQVLSTVEEITGFSKSFKHFSLKYSKMKPTFKTLCAGIMGLGLNHGVHRMALISEGISEKVLRNTINWFFTLSNIEAAYDSIVNKIGTLSLSNLYLHKENQLVTGSDGRKIPVAVDSLNANHSYKFPGKGSVVTFYGFLDSKQRQFYNTVFTSTNREAGYVIDGLLHNDTVKSDIHSTDTHGYMESVFTISHFVPAMFAPRLKNLKDQQIYSFEPRKYYVQKGYKILPCKRFNLKQIEDEWDPFLRFIVTIKLKHTPASQLLKRLSSYARDNPLYKALKEFGRIIKSIYILTYIQDKELRQMVQKTLNYVEQSNKFTKAISFANNQEFQYGTKEEQQVMAACTTLLQNAIVLWNYLTLSKKILAVADPKVRQKMINRMKKGSLLCWSYLNFQGEYNFSEKALKKNIFDMEKIKKLKI